MRSFVSPFFYVTMLAVLNATADPPKKCFSRTVPYFGALEQTPEKSWTKPEGRLKKQKKTIASLRQANNSLAYFSNQCKLKWPFFFASVI